MDVTHKLQNKITLRLQSFPIPSAADYIHSVDFWHANGFCWLEKHPGIDVCGCVHLIIYALTESDRNRKPKKKGAHGLRETRKN